MSASTTETRRCTETGWFSPYISVSPWLNWLVGPFLVFLVCPHEATGATREAGLLFHLSGDHGFTADFAQGDPRPCVVQDIQIIPGGAVGSGLRCPDFTQILTYWAPGNIYAERGTLSFFWRARDPYGATPFPIFQVSYSDHSTMDMAWLRIDYNGHGFDAFVTDASLARVRVSSVLPALPKPETWIHFALEWDETQGVRFYVDGELLGKKDLRAVFYAGLDKFGAHGDAMGPQGVATLEQFLRGGDIDEIRIYDRMLSGENIARLARGQSPVNLLPLVRDLGNSVYRNEWWLRYGWNRPGDVPPYLSASRTRVRKIEIHDAYDQKQWFWKANDGIRETTWPSPYNRSRLPGRNDYFTRPDWNCYSTSGKAVTFTLPEEPWNHLEIAGSAFGSLSYLMLDRESGTQRETHLFDRPQDQERTFHRLLKPLVGGKVRFNNAVQETPIGEFSAYYVEPGSAPEGIKRLTYRITTAKPDNPSLDALTQYIHGRFLPDERATLVALPEGAPRGQKSSRDDSFLPIIHVLIPFEFRLERPGSYEPRFSYTWENFWEGLDGIELELPALNVKPTHGDYFPMNIQIKDPLWPERNLMDFSFSVKPGEPRTLWLDTRDRILTNGYSLYLTIAGAGSDFSAESLEGAAIHLVFKDRKEAAAEHQTDSFTQIKANVGHFIEWGSNRKKLGLYERYSRDIENLLRINPDHLGARYYWSYLNQEQGWPAFEQPKSPLDVPLWAFRQIELLKLLRHFVNWWMDNRQIENGEFGGGLSDDGDFTYLWPGAALMGIDPEKITRSIHILMDAFYKNGMFTNGLNTIMADGLHAHEEGLNVQAQVMLLEYGNPAIVERIMESARALKQLTGLDALGHRHIRSSYFSATQLSEDGVWARSETNRSYLVLHPGLVLVEYNGHPVVKKLILELADGLLAHRHTDAQGRHYLPEEILFPSGEERGRDLGTAAQLFWAAWRWTGDEKYLLPIMDRIQEGEFGVLASLDANAIDWLEKRESWGKAIASLAAQRPGNDYYRHVAWQVTGNMHFLEEYYADQIRQASQRMSMFTEDQWWIDCVYFPSGELQRSRLGGEALGGKSRLYPGHAVSWRFKAPAAAENVAILVPRATSSEIRIIAFNLDSVPVTGMMTAWDLSSGSWDLKVGIDSDGQPESITRRETVLLERTADLELTFPPKAQTIVQLRLKSAGAPPWNYPDLAIGSNDLETRGDSVTVTVHSLGSVDSPACPIVLQDPSGKTVARATIPSLKAPLDLLPKTTQVTLQSSQSRALTGHTVRIDPEHTVREITTRNNSATIP